MRRDVCGWCGCALRPRDRRADRAAVVCRRCGTSMLVTADEQVAVLQASVRVHGTPRSLRIAPAWFRRRGGLRRVLALAGAGAMVAFAVWFGASSLRQGPVGWIFAAGLASMAFATVLSAVGGPFRVLRFGRGGVRRARQTVPAVVRAVLVEEVGWAGPVVRTRRHRVVYVDAGWRRRIVARFPAADGAAAVALARAVHHAVVGEVERGVPLEIRGAEPRATEAGV
ncbi:MAG: hypothetical protein JNM10_18330 [Planctomycetia bacterium]|nr:hypothetical protein [Planctomycetia bacterium]